MTSRIFINRRSGSDRRLNREQRVNPRLDLSHQRRRKTDTRRNNRNIADDFYASGAASSHDNNDRPTNRH
jgi:hypothetical protein